MSEGLSDRIGNWLAGGGDFDTGLALLGEVMPNVYYLNNIRRKGPVGGMKALQYELGKRVSTPSGRRTNPAPSSPLAGGQTSSQSQGKSQSQGQVSVVRGKKRVVLRDEFPFLNKAGCPEELKILVSDMISAHTRYQDAHERLFAVANKGEAACFTVAKDCVESYLENRLIWEELDYYKRSGSVLGHHPLFAKRMRRDELRTLDPIELMNVYRTLPRKKSYYKKLLDEDRDSAQTRERQEKLRELEDEHQFLKQLMGIRHGKRVGKGKAKGAKRKARS